MSNLNFNKIMLGGRLTADPELKQTATGLAVVSFSIAVNRRIRTENNTQPTADFFNVTAWRTLAEHIARYYRRGSSIFIVGSLQNRSWTDGQGNKRYATDVIAEDVYFVDSKSDAASDECPPRFENVPADEGLPF